MNVPAKELRRRARTSLAGNYGIAILACLIFMGIASICSGIISLPSMFSMFRNILNGQDIYVYESDPSAFFNVTFKVFANPLTVLFYAAYFVVIAPLSIGLANYFVHLADNNNPNVELMFKPFRYWLNAFVLELLIGLFVFLWSLLFIIPGIIASFRYSMARYILAEHPELKPTEALNLSKKMMKGNCGKFFCLHLSFIGWYILCIFTLGIGVYFLLPYVYASEAHFFNEVSGKNIEKAKQADQFNFFNGGGYGQPQNNGYGQPQQPYNGYAQPQQQNYGYGQPQQPGNGYEQSQQTYNAPGAQYNGENPYPPANNAPQDGNYYTEDPKE